VDVFLRHSVYTCRGQSSAIVFVSSLFLLFLVYVTEDFETELRALTCLLTLESMCLITDDSTARLCVCLFQHSQRSCQSQTWHEVCPSAHQHLEGLFTRDVKQSLKFRTSVLKFEFDSITFGIRISDYWVTTIKKWCRIAYVSDKMIISKKHKHYKYV